MVEGLRLFINGNEVEFETEPKILFTYQETDTSNPTVVKNSFTKSVQIPGTPNNNHIFGHYWDISRNLINGGGGSAYYNSSKKAPFQLFKGSALYEEGYIKLDSIKVNGEKIMYSVTLYGGLGDFFYQLSTADNGNKKKLSDLEYTGSGSSEFDFTINCTTVKTAWDNIENDNSRWSTINFMPAYNGTPTDFDTNKVVIDALNTSLQKGAKNASDNEWYYIKNNRWTIGELPQDMTEWEMRDLRSYLQRPCIRMKRIIEACCNPINNGGYNVNLDPDFFNSDNPYWEDTWLTLPMVTNLELRDSQQVMTASTLVFEDTTGSTSGLMYQDMHFNIGDLPSNITEINLDSKIYYSNAYSNSSYVWFWNYNGDDYHSGWWCLGSLFVQMIALNGDTVVGASQAYNLTTPVRHNGKLYYGHNGYYEESSGYDSSTGTRKMANGSKFYPYMDKPIYSILGKFNSNSDTNCFSREISPGVFEDTASVFRFHIDDITGPVTSIKMVYYWGATADKVSKYSTTSMFSSTYGDAWVFQPTIQSQGNGDPNGVHLQSTSVTHNLYAVIGESLGRTGTNINKQLLLNTESSPCDYLLSYCKMFGLHFVKELGENTINIMSRKTFYKGDEIVDLSELIDKSKDVTINPIMFSSKYYQLLQDIDESEMQKKYITAKGIEYGCKVLDTGYEFSSEKKNLLENNCIKSGIEVLEKSKWYSMYNNDAKLRPWMRFGMSYKLWKGDSEMDFTPTNWGDGDLYPLNEGDGMRYYDLFPKLQFHGDSGDGTDGNNCLVFFSGFKSINSGRANPANYILSDDNLWQTELNEGKPCWLFTNTEVIDGERFCYKLSEIPVFERYLTSNNSGSIAKSLDFGSAQELYIPNYSLTEDVNIYNSFWKTYLTDLFDVNTRKLTCNVRINDNPGETWLRRFYWFDNALWVIDKITDWNPASHETTKVDFVKVQDVANYTSVTQEAAGDINISASTYNIGYTGGTAVLSIYGIDNNTSWRLTKSGDASVSFSGYSASVDTITGTGVSNITVVFGPNLTQSYTSKSFVVSRTDNQSNSALGIFQGYSGEQRFTVSPKTIVIPYTGGTYDVYFNWYNQGNSYIDGYDYDDTPEHIDFVADINTYRYDNRAVLTVTPNAESRVLSNYCTFYSNTASYDDTVVLRQLPEYFMFAKSGETKTIWLGITGATFTNAPYWLTVIDNGNNSYNFIAEENLLDTQRSALVTVDVCGTTADFTVIQAGTSAVSPQTIGITADGGDDDIFVLIDGDWSVVGKPAWVSIDEMSGYTMDDITISCEPYSGSQQRTGSVVIQDDTSLNTYVVTITQEPPVGEILVAQPESIDFDSTGGTGTIRIISNTDWTIE